MSQSTNNPSIHLYWATGCTSCLRAKEFLERNEVSFVSHNVVDDRSILDEMAERGMPRHVPIIRRGEAWADAQTLEAVAEIAEIEHEADPLPVAELYDRLIVVLETVSAHLALVPEESLHTDIPNRPRSYGELVYHINSIPESFLEHEAGEPLRSYKTEPEWASRSKRSLETYAKHVHARVIDWRQSPGWDRDWTETADVYFGDPTVHEFFERTTWHAGQHTRQLEWVLEERLQTDFDPIDPATWEGLPMPEKVWDTV